MEFNPSHMSIPQGRHITIFLGGLGQKKVCNELGRCLSHHFDILNFFRFDPETVLDPVFGAGILEAHSSALRSCEKALQIRELPENTFKCMANSCQQVGEHFSCVPKIRHHLFF